MQPWKPLGDYEVMTNPSDWEKRAVRIAATLDRAADELTQLIDDIRRSRDHEPRKDIKEDERAQP